MGSEQEVRCAYLNSKYEIQMQLPSQQQTDIHFVALIHNHICIFIGYNTSTSTSHIFPLLLLPPSLSLPPDPHAIYATIYSTKIPETHTRTERTSPFFPTGLRPYACTTPHLSPLPIQTSSSPDKSIHASASPEHSDRSSSTAPPPPPPPPPPLRPSHPPPWPPARSAQPGPVRVPGPRPFPQRGRARIACA